MAATDATASAGTALSALPHGLRNDLLSAFNEITRNYREHRWEPAELNGGKFCEAVYTVIDGYIKGQYEPRSKKPRNIVDACKALEQMQAVRAVRIHIPRMVVALYEIRNNRGVGHSGAEVDPNHMDATAVLYMSKWLLAELVRVLHSTSTDEATAIVESLIEREVPLVWTMGDRKRILRTGLTWKQKMLLLLLQEHGAVAEADLIKWLEHPSAARLRRDVLRPGHKAALIDFDESASTVRLLPPGIHEAETLVNRTA